MKDATRNKICMIIAYALRMVATLCISGSLIQTFLKTLGFSSELVYIHSTFLQAATVLTIMFCARWADKGSIIKRAAVTTIPTGLLFFMYLPACISRSVSIYTYIFLLFVGIVQSISIGLHTVCEYKLPYFVYKREEYGTVSGISGMVGSLATLGVGALISLLSAKYGYIGIMLVAFVVSAVCMIASTLLTVIMKPISNIDIADGTEKKDKVPLLQVFKHPSFIGLLLPNFLRGVSAGIITVLAVVAFDLGFDEKVTTTMVSIQSIATLLGCLWFAFASKHISSRIWVFLGSMMLITIPMLLFTKSSIVFLSIYAVIVFGRTLVDYAVPVALLFVVPVEISGVYHAWRMILNNGGMLVATMIAAVLPVNALLILAAVCAVYSGLSYLLLPMLRKATPFFVREKKKGDL